MKLSERIIELRKLKQWSQEDLAEKTGVSRQAVSKWESGLSVPDMDKIVQMSDLFEVTTDYLLREKKSDMQNKMNQSEKSDKTIPAVGKRRLLSFCETDDFLRAYRTAAVRISASIAALILSPCYIILAGGAAAAGYLPIRAQAANNIGVVIMFCSIIIAVFCLVAESLKLKRYKQPDYAGSIPDPETAASVTHRMIAYESGPYVRSIAGGVAGCIFSVIPLIIGAFLNASTFAILCLTMLMFIIVAVSVRFFVYAGMIRGSFKKILRKGED